MCAAIFQGTELFRQVNTRYTCFKTSHIKAEVSDGVKLLKISWQSIPATVKYLRYRQMKNAPLHIWFNVQDKIHEDLAGNNTLCKYCLRKKKDCDKRRLNFMLLCRHKTVYMYTTRKRTCTCMYNLEIFIVCVIKWPDVTINHVIEVCANFGLFSHFVYYIIILKHDAALKWNLFIHEHCDA